MKSFVLDSALGFLLFSDAMELDIVSLKRSIEVIFVLAVFTTLVSQLPSTRISSFKIFLVVFVVQRVLSLFYDEVHISVVSIFALLIVRYVMFSCIFELPSDVFF